DGIRDFHVTGVQPSALPIFITQQPVQTRLTEQETTTNAPQDAERSTTVRRQGRKVRPNEPCPCGSGRKYKHCHGAPTKRGQASRSEERRVGKGGTRRGGRRR